MVDTAQRQLLRAFMEACVIAVLDLSPITRLTLFHDPSSDRVKADEVGTLREWHGRELTRGFTDIGKSRGRSTPSMASRMELPTSAKYIIPYFNGWPIFRDGRTKKKTLDFRPDTDNEDPTGQYLSHTETRFKACLVAFRSITPPLEGRDPVTASLVTSLNMPPFRWIFSFSRIVLTVG